MVEGLRKLLKAGKCMLMKQEVDKVVCENEEIKMLNIRNRKKKEEVIEGEKGNAQNLGLENLVTISLRVKYFNRIVF